MLLFVDSATVAYMNSGANFRGMSHTADDDIELYFASATGSTSYDKVVLSCTDEKQVEAMKGLAGAIHGSAAKAFTVIADDVASKYCHPNVTAIESVTLSATGNFIPKFMTWSAALELTAADSGAVVRTGDVTAGILTLPAPALAGAGWFVDVKIAHTQGTAATHITSQTNGGYFLGGYMEADKDGAGDPLFFAPDGDSNDWINLDTIAKGNAPGGSLRIICDGTNFEVSGLLVGDGSLVTAFADGES